MPQSRPRWEWRNTPVTPEPVEACARNGCMSLAYARHILCLEHCRLAMSLGEQLSDYARRDDPPPEPKIVYVYQWMAGVRFLNKNSLAVEEHFDLDGIDKMFRYTLSAFNPTLHAYEYGLFRADYQKLGKKILDLSSHRILIADLHLPKTWPDGLVVAKRFKRQLRDAIARTGWTPPVPLPYVEPKKKKLKLTMDETFQELTYQVGAGGAGGGGGAYLPDPNMRTAGPGLRVRPTYRDGIDIATGAIDYAAMTIQDALSESVVADPPPAEDDEFPF